MQKYVVRQIPRPEPEILKRYRELDTSTVYEAQGKIGLMHHSLKPVIPGKSICGPAVTVICPAGDNLMIHAAIEVCRPGDVLVATTIGESVHGMIGELIVRALIKRGVQGVVIDSGIRDAARIRELGFPIWSKAIQIRHYPISGRCQRKESPHSGQLAVRGILEGLRRSLATSRPAIL